MAEGFTPAEDFYSEPTQHEDYSIFDYDPSDLDIIYDPTPEEVEIKTLDGWKYESGTLIPPKAETSFVDILPDTPGSPEYLEKQEKIKSFYKYFEDSGYKVDKNAPLEYKASFRMNADKSK